MVNGGSDQCRTRGARPDAQRDEQGFIIVELFLCKSLVISVPGRLNSQLFISKFSPKSVNKISEISS